MAQPETPIAVILNPAAGHGGGGGIAARVTECFAARSRTVKVTPLGDGISVGDTVRDAVASGAPAVVAAGGDGTINAVASALVGSDTPLGVLPVGTLNHFAKDLGLPLGLEEAVAVIVVGKAVAVDVGEVNGRIFLNNSSLGVYPRIVELRDQYREKGAPKWAAAAWAGAQVLRRSPLHSVRIESAGGRVVRRTPFVFVGNNEYTMAGLQAGSRESLTGGRLAVYVMRAEGRPNLMRVAWQVLTRGVEQTPELDLIAATESVVETRRRNLAVALDGEVVTLQSPLRYRLLPGALRVLTH